ncbi:BnaA05g15440D [Brassica napus]|uniref:tRNA-5-taurinomethyluridine 2-sulfurtransferase n=1 Tax=Brassica napus TaxID=3708 RepID=A0A078GVU4_BRANA|nr:BnaA05g15440D [Brassica napus]
MRQNYRIDQTPMLSAVVKPLPSLFRLPPLSSSSLSLYFRVSPSPQSPRLLFSRRSYSRHAFLGDHHLSCSMPNKPLRVAVLLSGGVDSSVALRLLHAAGHSFTPFYLKIWFQEGFENFWNQCPWEDDLKYAKHVCEQVDVPLEVVHLTDEYWERVVSYIIEEYRCGRTPNPDVLCNTRIKFGAFMDAISGMEYDYIASGHYAKVVHPPADQTDSSSVLELSQDMVPNHVLFFAVLERMSHVVFNVCILPTYASKRYIVKDQTYFLSHLSQTQLKRLLFPLGCVKKEEVRKLATEFDLPNKDRKDSQGICFLGKIKFSDFVGRHIGEMEGIILEAETGDFLGNHRGFWFYTIGQRQGLRLPGGPWYVVEKDTKNNVVFVSRNYYSMDKRRRVFRVGSLRWLSGKPSGNVNQLRCKVRHGPGFYSCSFEMEGDVAVVHLDEDAQGLAAGQFAAFYEGTTCIGSGVILESWDDQCFPVCAKALELAALEDKTKLGKPVKIKTMPVTTSVEAELVV